MPARSPVSLVPFLPFHMAVGVGFGCSRNFLAAVIRLVVLRVSALAGLVVVMVSAQ
jgi:hypothetical protein